MDTDTDTPELTLAHIEMPEGAINAREIRIVEYRNEDGSVGMAIGVQDEISFDLIRTLGLISMAGTMLAKEQVG
jgi:hypothetical protein